MFDVIDLADLTGRLPFRSHDGIVAVHARAVVGNADELASTGGHDDIDPRGTRIKRVFEEFFDSGGRAFDNFACGDFVGHSRRQHPNLGTLGCTHEPNATTTSPKRKMTKPAPAPYSCMPPATGMSAPVM